MKVAINRAYSWFTRLVWEPDLRQLSTSLKVAVFIARVLHMLVRELLGGQLNLRAMSLVYTTLLSLVPLLAVSLSVLKGFGVHNQIEPMLYNFLKPLGSEGAVVADKIVSFVDNVEVGVLGSVGLVLLIYTVIALLQKIEKAFNYVWQVEHLRPIVRRISSYLSVVLIGPVLLFFATVLSSDIAQRLIAIKPFSAVLLSAGELLPYLLVCLAFTFIYIFMPNTRVQVRAAVRLLILPSSTFLSSWHPACAHVLSTGVNSCRETEWHCTHWRPLSFGFLDSRWTLCPTVLAMSRHFAGSPFT